LFGNSLEYTIMLINGSSNTVSGNRIFFNPAIKFARSNAGIYMFNQSFINCRSNIISNCGVGIWLENCSGNLEQYWVSDNAIDTCGNGILIRRCSDLTVLQNQLFNCTYGIYIHESYTIGVSSNTITHCSNNGITIDVDSEYCIISNNQISDNEGNGVSFSWLSGCWAINNTILNNEESGVFVEYSLVCWIDGNTINNNGGSGVIFDSTLFCEATDNEISNNDGWGIVINDSPTTTESNNIFDGNGLGNVGYNVTLPTSESSSSYHIYLTIPLANLQPENYVCFTLYRKNTFIIN